MIIPLFNSRYNGVVNLYLGYDSMDTGIYRDTDYKPGSPIIWYGTSIAQGGVVSRPGQAFTNRISRELDREVLNFGR